MREKVDRPQAETDEGWAAGTELGAHPSSALRAPSPARGEGKAPTAPSRVTCPCPQTPAFPALSAIFRPAYPCRFQRLYVHPTSSHRAGSRRTSRGEGPGGGGVDPHRRNHKEVAGEPTCAGPSGSLVTRRGSMGRGWRIWHGPSCHLDEAPGHARVKLRRSSLWHRETPGCGAGRKSRPAARTPATRSARSRGTPGAHW